MQYLQQIEGVLCIKNEKNELLWYVRGKSVHGDNRGQIYRPNHQPKTNFDLSTNSHGNRSNTCIQNNNKNNGNHNKNNHNGNNKAKVDCNNNAPNGIGGGGHYDYQRNGTPLVWYFILHFVFFFFVPSIASNCIVSLPAQFPVVIYFLLFTGTNTTQTIENAWMAIAPVHQTMSKTALPNPSIRLRHGCMVIMISLVMIFLWN